MAAVTTTTHTSESHKGLITSPSLPVLGLTNALSNGLSSMGMMGMSNHSISGTGSKPNSRPNSGNNGNKSGISSHNLDTSKSTNHLLGMLCLMFLVCF